MIGPGGVEIVTDGGLDVGATIAGGTQDITGLAIGAQIASSGSAMLSAGGAMVSATLAATGSAFVLSGGLAIATLVDPAATLIISSGGMADATALSGTEVISAGGTDFGAAIRGGNRTYLA
jgi:antigen 43